MDIGGNMIGDEAFVVGDGVFVGYNMLEKQYILCRYYCKNSSVMSKL